MPVVCVVALPELRARGDERGETVAGDRQAGIQERELERLRMPVAPVDGVGDDLSHDARIVELLAAHQGEHRIAAVEIR